MIFNNSVIALLAKPGSRRTELLIKENIIDIGLRYLGRKTVVGRLAFKQTRDGRGDILQEMVVNSFAKAKICKAMMFTKFLKRVRNNDSTFTGRRRKKNIL